MSKLFASTRLGRVTLKNAIAMAPLTRQRADVKGVPQPHVVDYYAQRAGAGLIIAEGTQPTFEGQGYPRTPGIHTPEQIAAWRRVTDAVHAKGSFMFLQVMHAGRIAHRLNRQVETQPVAPSAVKPAGQMYTDQKGMQDYETPHAVDTHEIPALIGEFVIAAKNAVAAGFDGVEIHAANGYLHNQFLASNTNQRTDAYGGSLANRIRFTVETVAAVSAAIGADRTAIRISPGHMFNDLVDANPLETHRALLSALDTGALAYVHVMLPDAFAAALNNAGDPKAILPALRPLVKGRLMGAGGFTASTAEAALAEGLLDLVAFGRPFIANPDFVERVRLGKSLAIPNEAQFYTPGPEGYSDYPAAT